MFFHQFGKNLVLAFNLGFEEGDAFLGSTLLCAAIPLKRHCAILKKFLLPTIENRRLQIMRLAYFRYGNFLHQVATKKGHLLLGCKMSAVLVHDFSFLTYTFWLSEKSYFY